MAEGKKAANNAIDFNKVRKKRQRLTTIKRFVILLAIFGGVILVLVANNWMIEQGITTQISDLIGGIGGSGYPVRVPGGVIRDVKGAGNHLAVLNDANLLIYSDKGRQTANFQAMTDTTVLLASEDRFLTFAVGNRGFAVHSSTQTPFEQELEYGILAGGMNAAGDFAIVSSSKQAICEIAVYSRSFDQIYFCTLAENLATSVSVSPRGDRMAVGWMNGKEGVLVSGVNVYQLSKDDGPVSTIDLGEDLILDVRYFEEGRIGVLTDTRYLLLDPDGEITHSYLFGDRQLVAFESEGRQMLFLCEGDEGAEVILLDDECEEQATFAAEENVADMALSSRRIYLLTASGIRTYDHAFAEQEETPLQFGNHIELVGSRLYYLSRDEIGVLGQASQAGQQTPTEPESVFEPFGSEQETEPETEETTSDPEETTPETEPGTEYDTEPETEPETEYDTEPETEPDTEPETDTEPDTEPEDTEPEDTEPDTEPTDEGENG